MATSAISGNKVWDGLDRDNSLQPVALVIYDPSQTGYRPARVADLSSNVSGSFSVGNVAVTGGNINATITNPIEVSNALIISGSAANTSSNFTVASGDGTVLAANQSRYSYHIQNLSTGVLFVKEGAEASPTSFSYILAGGSALYDGRGGLNSDDIWKGVLSVANPVGLSGLYLASELT